MTSVQRPSVHSSFVLQSVRSPGRIILIQLLDPAGTGRIERFRGTAVGWLRFGCCKQDRDGNWSLNFGLRAAPTPGSGG
ncbi:hypothetical protein R1flu_020964 [Riccia fluitans]|uniref:Uncharacterized protein n=1 Tax=Riccia fluitans TaxID=41844 RepID=A0ABD1ZQ10_9MARC